MKTKQLKVDKSVDNLISCPQIAEAAQLLLKNEVVAFPTETVYGLGGNAKNDEAISKIYQAKGRPSDNPLIIHIARRTQLDEFAASIPEEAERLMDTFWPGSLSIIFPLKKGVISEKATAGLTSVAVRMPDHPVALAIIEKAGLPIAAPSANASGKPSPTTAAHVWNDLQGKIAAIVDGGETGVGVESTVIDCTGTIPTILRPGGITKEQLEQVLGKVEMDIALHDQTKAPKAPGMKYRHYAPNAPLYIVYGDKDFLQHLITERKNEGKTVAVLTTEENKGYYSADAVYVCGKRSSLATVAHSLYSALRSFDNQAIDIIYSEAFPKTDVGAAIMNRLMKAAGQKVIIQENR
ncbi:threonylcarbamoyl-AMP synthase [Bacillaceae bacterium Marseille-Q3522]|nr:threonylcarbamoyl-AMP synthase [Bacillaceae bacterium Marseille-Q3522]